MTNKHVLEILKDINKGKNDFGELTTYGSKVEKVPVIPSGVLSLDIISGIGGYPMGRVIEIYGQEASGKTTLTLHAIASAQRRGLITAFIDAEHALEMSYARQLGVNPEEMIFNQPSCGEQAFEIAIKVAEAMKNGGLIVIDSVAGLTPQCEINGEMGDANMGAQARLMGQGLRKIVSIISKNNVTLLFVNQIRQKIGVTFGSNLTTTGGNALKFYASLRIDIKSIGKLTSNGVKYGQKTKIVIMKNKFAPPFKEVETEIRYGYGIPRLYDVIDLSVDAGIVKKSGSWYQYEDNKLGNGKEATANELFSMPEVFSKIEAEVLKHHGISTE